MSCMGTITTPDAHNSWKSRRIEAQHANQSIRTQATQRGTITHTHAGRPCESHVKEEKRRKAEKTEERRKGGRREATNVKEFKREDGR